MAEVSARKVALVTGGARGIGLGISEALARAGYDLVICGVRPPEAVRDILLALAAPGGRAHYVQADVSQAADRARLLEETRREFGALHLLVNNAGVAPLQRLDVLEATEESFERVMRINLQGPYFLTQAVANWMREQRAATPGFTGCIVNVSSISATVVSPNRGEYCVSKAGLSMATQLFAVRLAEEGIPVYEVRPGVTRSDMTEAVKEKYDRLIQEGLVPQRRWGLPEDTGRAVVMLARGDLPYSTGQVLMVDGGLTIPRL
jgi:NAD(P)-dependent dehydrogenase (short-subunit alcohol dehydrogenase family)